MSFPILRHGDALVVALSGDVTDTAWHELRDELVREAGSAKGAVLDVSRMDVMDSFATRVLRGIVQSLRLRGVDAVVAGIQPEVAIAMVRLGLTLEDTYTALDLDDAMAWLRRRERA